jgi:hypothetical protein
MFAIMHALGMFVADLFKSRNRLLKLVARVIAFDGVF